MGIKKLVAVVALLVLFAASPATADSATVSGIAKQLICQCGCGMVLSSCTHAECASREAMTAFIGQALGQGKSEAQIIQSFVVRYGEQVLASPPKRGFNLVAWVLPFAAILGGGGVIYIALKKWVWQGRQSQAGTMAEAEVEDDEYQRRLEQELKEFRGGSFR